MSTFTFLLLITSSLFSLLLPLIIFSIFKSRKQNPTQIPKSYPFLGHYFALKSNWNRRAIWVSEILRVSPTATFKTHFPNYQKGDGFRTVLSDLLGDGIFNADGDTWKLQRLVASHEFSTKSLRKFIETVVDAELTRRLIPILSAAAKNRTILDFQDILQRFAFDNICQIAFGYDPACLLPSLPPAKFAEAFEESVRISSGRFNSLFWRIKRALNIGSEKRLRLAVSQVRDFAVKLVREKKEELKKGKSVNSVDLLSRFLSSGHSDEKFVTDIVISFIIAGRDTTSAALTWFFWLINEKSENPVFEEVKDMVFTHASLCESMRLYPPVPADTKVAEKMTFNAGEKGTAVTYHPYSMGRLAAIWGSGWPERWLRRDKYTEKWKFDGPRICLGKEMAFLQMKKVIAGVLSRCAGSGGRK